MNQIVRSIIITVLLTSFVWAEPSRGSGTPYTIRGTFTWEVGAEGLGKAKKPDFWWEHASETERYLVPQNGAEAAVVELPFDSLSEAQAKEVKLTSARISGQQLRPGRVVIFKTASGRLGKFEIVGYKPLVTTKHNYSEYDLNVKWLFF